MNAPFRPRLAPAPASRAERKAALVAASARARADLRLQLEPMRHAEAAASRLFASAAGWVRRPIFVGAAAALLVVAGPRGVLRGVRWGVRAVVVRPLIVRGVTWFVTRLFAELRAKRGGAAAARPRIG